MDTDRKLLELAAIADGLKLQPGEVFAAANWSPLTDDGDAMRLAVNLEISITPYPIYKRGGRHSVIAKQRRPVDYMKGRNPTEVFELYGDDPAAAWRRAIVRCAAEIGRGA